MTVEAKDTRFGTVYRKTDGCKDDYSNIITSRLYRKTSGVIRRRPRKVTITAQRPAVEAFRRAEVLVGREIVVTGTARSCALQASLFKLFPSRYAPPWVGLHCQALAIDVSTNDPQLQTTVREALLRVGFTQSRPDDEPWHFSYGWTA